MANVAEVSDRSAPPPPGTRVVVDLRPLQESERSPLTASYLRGLLSAYAARPIAGESFLLLLRTGRDHPVPDLEAAGLPVAGRRYLPPTTRAFRSAGLTIDSLLLRGAEFRSAAGARDAGAAGAVYHTAGGAVPVASRLPIVATLLDLAPWELPAIYARSPAARFGHRLRARALHDAGRLIVTSQATAESARRLLQIEPDRIAVIPLAPEDPFTPWDAERVDVRELRERFGLPVRYFVVAARYDARKDLGTLFGALRALRDERPPSTESTDPWPPLVVLAGGAGDDESDASAMARGAARHGVAYQVRVTPRLDSPELAALMAAARGFVFPALSEGSGLPVLNALGVGVPVIASRTGPLPEIVGPAGIIVEPGDEVRLAAALRTLWGDERVHTGLARAAQDRARGPRRTWDDVARETRLVYAESVAGAARGGRAERLGGVLG